jgi:hypothetical protein
MTTVKIMTREEFQRGFIDADFDFYSHLPPEQINARYQKILEREYLNYVEEQVQRIRSIEC